MKTILAHYEQIFSRAIKAPNLFLVHHLFRAGIKLYLLVLVLSTSSVYKFPLLAHIIASEVIAQLLLRLLKLNPDKKKLWIFLLQINFITLINTAIYLLNLVSSDQYILYLVYSSMIIFTYGIGLSLISFTYAFISYIILLIFFHSDFINLFRLILFVLIPLSVYAFQKSVEEKRKQPNTNDNIEKTKENFIDLASHNLRTPIAAIYGYIEILLRGDVGKLSDQQEIYLNRIKTSNQELEKLTEELIQISLLEVSTKVNLLAQPTQLETVIDAMVENYGPVALAKNIKLSYVRPKEKLPMINVDIEKIKSVFVNIIDNAIRYTDKGTIEINTVTQGNIVSVSVKDTGKGIAADELPNIFTKFFRAGNVLNYDQAGVGLGLYINKIWIELHGGKIWAESTLGQGTTVMFTLPTAQASESNV